MITSDFAAASLVADNGASAGSQTSTYERYERSFGKNCVFSCDINTPPPIRNSNAPAITFHRDLSPSYRLDNTLRQNPSYVVLQSASQTSVLAGSNSTTE